MPETIKGHILVVDDNVQNLALATAALEDDGYRVREATSGEEALAALLDELPDCVLLDVRMPGMDGFATCERLRQLPGAKGIPVVFLTAQRDLETFERAISVGGDDFLTKPLSPAELLVRVQAALKLGHMTHELREHYDLVRRQRDDLMRLQLQKEQLSSFVIHDIKNPINTVDLHAQLLLRRAELSERSRHSVEQIRQEVRSIMRLVLNLLDISKSDEGTLVAQLQKVDLGQLVSEVAQEFRIRAESGRISIATHLEAWSVKADPDLLKRVLENLLDNAIRYAPEDSQVTLSAGPAGELVAIRVADQGKGIPEAMRERVFDRFARLGEDGGAGRSGRGLGLQFCKLAVQAQGGSIAVEEASPGAVFCVKLPPA